MPIVVVALAACGYAPVRTQVPAGVRRVAVERFAIGGGAPQLGSLIAERVAAELAAAPGVSLSSAGEADAFVTGRADLAAGEEGVLAGAAESPRTMLVEVALDVRASLLAADGRELRRVGPLRVRADRSVQPGGAADLAREARALRALAAEAARVLVSALFVAP